MGFLSKFLDIFSQDECIRIHETDVKSVRRKPDFDVDTVIVALRKLGKTIGINFTIQIIEKMFISRTITTH